MSRTKNVFISHAHEDDDEVRNLKELLAKRGYKLRDSSVDSSKPNDATSEDYIKTKILAPRITWAGTVIVLISPETCKHWWVDWEIEYAQRTETRTVGIWLPGAKESDLPKSLELYADAIVGWNTDSIIGAINGTINNWVGPDGQPRSPREIPRFDCSKG